MSRFLLLTPFEELMHRTGTAAYPANCYWAGKFEGAFEPQALAEALRDTLESHPLLKARIERKWGRLGWTWESTREPTITWRPLVESPTPCSRPFDLRREPGVEIKVYQDDHRAEVLAQFHHACCDGKGFLRFLQDLLIAYAKRRDPAFPDARLPPVVPNTLGRRGRHHWSAIRRVSDWGRQSVGLVGAAQFFSRRPAPIVCDNRPVTAATEPRSAILGHRLPAEQLMQLKHAANDRGVTLNDFLARDLLVATQRWRQDAGLGGDDDWLRMMIPINMREKADRDLPAANVVSSVFLDRRGSDCLDPEPLLDSIRHEIEIIKTLKLGHTFPQLLALSRLLPGGLARMNHNSNRVSLIFSNLGVILTGLRASKHGDYNRYTDVTLRKCFAAVPITPFTNLSVCVHQYAKQLAIDLHYDASVISRSQADAFMSRYREQIDASASLSKPPVASNGGD